MRAVVLVLGEHDSSHIQAEQHIPLFDLVAIKTITTFSSRPLRWFALLALPFASIAMACLIWAIRLALEADASLVVVAGLAVIYAGGAAFLVICGILSELVYKTGKIRPTDFFRLPDTASRKRPANHVSESISG